VSEDNPDHDSDGAESARHHPFVVKTVKALENRRHKALLVLEGKCKGTSDPDVRQAVTEFLALDEQVTFWGGKPAWTRKSAKL